MIIMVSESEKLYEIYLNKSKEYNKEYSKVLSKIKKHDEYKQIQSNIEELQSLLLMEKKKKRLFSRTKASELIGYKKDEVDKSWKEFIRMQDYEMTKAKFRVGVENGQ